MSTTCFGYGSQFSIERGGPIPGGIIRDDAVGRDDLPSGANASN